MTRRPASAADQGADFAWPPVDAEVDGVAASAPTLRPAGTATPTHHVEKRTASAPAEALPDGARELEWPPSAETLSTMSLVSVETGRELALDPDTGTLIARPAVPSARPPDRAARPRSAAIPPRPPAAGPVGRPLRRVAIGLALAGLLALTAPPTLELWRIAVGQGPPLPPPPRVLAPRSTTPPPLPAQPRIAETHAAGLAPVSAPSAMGEPAQATAPPAPPGPRGDDDPTAGLTAIPAGEPLPLPAPPPRP